MAKAYSGLGQETGGANHPGVNDIDQFGHDLGHEERTKWLMENLGVSRSLAESANSAIYDYTLDAYDVIHSGEDDRGLTIDDIIHNPNAPVYTGAQYRGLFITQDGLDEFTGGGMTPREYLENILKTGVWKEPGVSSFSASQGVAMNFGKFNNSWKEKDSVSVMLHYTNGKSGMPIKHLSQIPGEDEILHSGEQMREGMDIAEFRWYNGPKGLELHITVTDKPVKRR